MTFDDETISWLTYAVLAFDAALVLWTGHRGDQQPVLFPRTLCRGQRMSLVPIKRKKRRRESRSSRHG